MNEKDCSDSIVLFKFSKLKKYFFVLSPSAKKYTDHSASGLKLIDKLREIHLTVTRAVASKLLCYGR